MVVGAGVLAELDSTDSAMQSWLVEFCQNAYV